MKEKTKKKKKKDLCIEKLNTDLKRDLTRSVDYANSDKDEHLVTDMMVGIPQQHQHLPPLLYQTQTMNVQAQGGK